MTFFCIPTLALYFASDLNAQCVITKSLSVAPRLFVCSCTHLIHGVKCQVVAFVIITCEAGHLLKLVYHDIRTMYHDNYSRRIGDMRPIHLAMQLTLWLFEWRHQHFSCYSVSWSCSHILSFSCLKSNVQLFLTYYISLQKRRGELHSKIRTFFNLLYITAKTKGWTSFQN